MFKDIGHRLAPPRFLAFLAIFAAGLAIGIPTQGWGRGTMAAFDVAAVAFFAMIAPLLTHAETRTIREAARANDANRAVLLAFSGVVLLAILVAVAKELQGRNDFVGVVLAVTTLALAWLFGNTMYALHYAHLFYMQADGGTGDAGGLCFPGDLKEPNYWDFLYFSYTLGMTFQTSDVDIASRHVRIVVIFHCLAAFVFNLGVIAFSINVLGGGH